MRACEFARGRSARTRRARGSGRSQARPAAWQCGGGVSFPGWAAEGRGGAGRCPPPPAARLPHTVLKPSQASQGARSLPTLGWACTAQEAWVLTVDLPPTPASDVPPWPVRDRGTQLRGAPPGRGPLRPGGLVPRQQDLLRACVSPGLCPSLGGHPLPQSRGQQLGKAMRVCPLPPVGHPQGQAGSAQHLSSLCSAPSSGECPSLTAGVGGPGTAPAHGLIQSAPWTVLRPPRSCAPGGGGHLCGAGDPCPARGRATDAAEACRRCQCRQAHSPPPVASGTPGPPPPAVQHPGSGRVDAKVGVALPSARFGPGACSSCCPWAGGCPVPRPRHGVSGQSAATSSPWLLVGGGVASWGCQGPGALWG